MKKYFIPCIDNEYKPHFFRGKSAAYLAALIIALFLITSAIQYSISINSSLFATVVSAVLVDLTNSNRVESDISPLALSPILAEAAQLKANDMAAKEYFAHTSPEGITPWFWFEAVNYGFSYAGENLAISFSDSEDVERAWMNSPGHRANILNENFTEIGIATAHGIYQGQETTFVVQLFGRPSQTMRAVNAAEEAGEEEKTIEESETSIAVQNTEEASAKPTSSLAQAIVAQNKGAEVLAEESTLEIRETPVPTYASFIGRIISSPNNVLGYLYLLLGAIISLALILMVFIEIRRQHPLHIVYALSLLVLIVGLYLLQTILFPSVIII